MRRETKVVSYEGMVEYRLLGPVTAYLDGDELSVSGRKPRALLAMLLLQANRPVSRDLLIEGLWGESPPAAAGHTLDGYVSTLRRLLGAERILRKPPGYQIRLDPGELDLARFEAHLEAGSAALARGAADEAGELLRAALSEWRGTALADVLDAPFAAAAARDLEERRLLAVEQRLEAELACGAGRELVAELKALVREQPFRERPVAQLMLAQYRSGDAAAALDTFSRARRRFAEELGLEPSNSLRLLERRILENDVSLAGINPSDARPVRVPVRRLRRRLLLAAAIAAVGAGAAVGITIAAEQSGGQRGVRLDEQGLIALRADGGEVQKSIALSVNAAGVTAAAGSLWVADPNGDAILRVSPAAATVVDRIPVGGAPGALAAGGGAVWVVTTGPGAVARIDTGTDSVTQTIPLGVNPSAVAFGAGAVWVADPSDQSLIELDPGSGAVRDTVTLTTRPTAIAIGAGDVWVASYDEGTVTEVDPYAGVPVATTAVGQGPAALTADRSSVWVADQLDGTVSRIDPETASVRATVATGSGPTAIAVAHGAVWVANEFSRTIARIDERRGELTAMARSAGAPTALASMAGSVWAATRPIGRHRGGKLVLLGQSQISSMDPALEYEVFPPQLHGLAYDALVTFDHSGGPRGLRIVPDLALALPTPADDRRTYAFRLRPGIQYADGRPLRASDFRRSFERLFRVSSPIAADFAGLLGAARCGRTRCDLRSGVVTDDRLRTVVFHLATPDPDFLFKLAFVLTAPVPPGTPWHELRSRPFPGTGPYRIERAGRREIVLVRNRYFHEWSYAAQPDGNPDTIVWRFGLSPAREVRAVEAGRADWTFDNVPGSLLREVETLHAAQFHSNAIPQTDFLQINTRRPPFNDVRARRALNLAIDRRVIVRLYGGPNAATATCQVLPPGVPGYRPYCPYTVDPDREDASQPPNLRLARRLVAASGTRGRVVRLWAFRDDASIRPVVIRYIASSLKQLGYTPHVGWTTFATFDHVPTRIRRGIHLLASSWYADYPAASDFFEPFLACHAAYSFGGFCDEGLDREMRQAEQLQLTDAQRAATLWSRVDRKAVDKAAWVPLVNSRRFDFVSSRIENYQDNPMWGFLADQVWLR